MPDHIERLARKLREVHQAISDLSSEDIGGQLGPIIHRPGWTTVAEFALVDASLEALHRHLEVARIHCRRLIEAAGHVNSNGANPTIPPPAPAQIDIARLAPVSVKQFTFFMKAIAENDLWDEAELHLEGHGCTSVFISAEPVGALQSLLQNKIRAGETLTSRGRFTAFCHCGVGPPGPPGGPPRFPPGPGGGGPDGGPPPGPPPDGGGPPPGPPPPTPE